MLLHLIGILLVVGQIHSLSFQGCFPKPKSSSDADRKNEDDSQNNFKCVNFCRKKYLPLAATNGRHCECMISLPSEAHALASEKDADGPKSRCNVKCPGDLGDQCEKQTCCGGAQDAISVYGTGDFDLNKKLFEYFMLNKDVRKKLGEGAHIGYVQRTPGKPILACYANLEERGKEKCYKSTEEDLTKIKEKLPDVEFYVEDAEENLKKSNTARSVPLKGFDLEISNAGGNKEATMKRIKTVTQKAGVKRTTETGSERGFTLGAKASAGFDAIGASFNFELSAEYSSKKSWKTGTEKSNETTTTDTVEITVKVPAGGRVIVRFEKCFSDRILKWRSKGYARGAILVRTPQGDKWPLFKNVSLSAIMPPKDRRFYAFGTIRGEANPRILATIETINADGKKSGPRPATKEEAKMTPTNGKVTEARRKGDVNPDDLNN